MPRAQTDTRQRIVEAAIDAAGKVGLRRLTMDDVARSGKLARVTLYKHFPGKQEVLEAAMLFELRRLLAQVESVLHAQDDPEDSLVEGFVTAIRLLREHPVIAHLLRTEPEALMPHLIGPSAITEAAQRWASEQVSALAPDELALSPDRAGELLMRIVHSVAFLPSRTYATDDDEQLRQMARDWLLPPMLGLAS